MSRAEADADLGHEMAGRDVAAIRTSLWIAGIVGAVALWWLSLPLIDADELNDYGLVAILPWQFWSAIVLLSVSFAANLKPMSRTRWACPLALLVLILILHATPPIVYGTLRYSWAWKHIGIVDFIQRYGEVDRRADFLSAYHNWPGFFWISAKVANLLNLQPLDIASVARFAPVVSNIVFAALLKVVYGRFTDNVQLVWASLWIFLCANWVGQDYFSPQALAYALHLAVLALCLGPLMPQSAHRAFDPLRTRSRLAQLPPSVSFTPAWLKVGAVFCVAAMICAIVASHQLTPVILAFSLMGLSLFTPLSFGYPTIAFLAVVLWISYPAAPFTALYLPGEVADIGQTIEGVTDKMVNTSSVGTGVAVVAWAGRALVLLVGLMAFIGWLRRLRHGEPTALICILAIAPALVLGITSYGGEAIFRIYFFCLPFLAFFAGSAFFSRDETRGVASRLLFVVLAAVMAFGFLLGNNGKDRQYRFSPEEVEAAHWLYRQGKPGTLLVEGARSYPSQFMNYENFTYVPISNERSADRAEILNNPSEVLSRWFASARWNDGYVIITRSQTAYVEALAITPKGAFSRLELELLASPKFLLVFANKDARIFRASRFVQK